MKSPKATDPLTKEEMEDAAQQFFPLFNVVHTRMPDGSTIEDTLKVMETVAKLGHKTRAKNKEHTSPFGFNKKEDENGSD